MSALAILLGVLKAFAIVMFAMNVAVVLTWVERRQASMIQDRVGPERAVAWLPRNLARALLTLPAFAVAAAILYSAYTGKVLEGAERTGRAMLMSQLAIFACWATLLVIAGRVVRRGPKNSFDGFVHQIGDPRRIFFAGLGLHALTVLVAATLRGTDLGRQLREFAYGAGPAILAFAIVGGSLYAALRLRHDRIGLRLAGLLHPAADGVKTAWKEDFIPPNADRLLHSLAPIISFFPALVVLGTVPFGDTLCFGKSPAAVRADGIGAWFAEVGKWLGSLVSAVPKDGVCTDGAVSLQVADLNVGILYFFALAGTGVVGAALAGWSSDNKFSLLGGLRAASQMVSYEVTLGLTVVGALMVYGSLRIDEMVRWQAQNAWGIFVQPVAFVLFFAATIAEAKRIPFDLPEGESEIVAGYYTEYSGMKFAMFFFSEYVAVVSASALMAALFFGGWHLPFVERSGIHVAVGDTILFTQQISHGAVVALGVLAFVAKTVLLCWLSLTVRWTLPRFRYDQLMKLGWRKLLPASLVNILVTGLLVLALGSGSAALERGLRVTADLTEAVAALAGLGGFVWLVLFFLEPARHRQLVASTAARFAQQLGGTRTARMGA